MSEKTSEKTASAKETPASAKKDAAPSASSTASETTATASESAAPAPAGKRAAPSRPISYFSSVSTDEYRSGWDKIFSNKAKSKPSDRANGKAAATRPATGRRRPAAPAVLELEPAELDAELRARLDAAFRRKAKERRIGYARRAKRWRLQCEIGG